MITINLMGESINGSVNNEQFGVPYSKETYESMLKLQADAEKVTSMKDYLLIVEDFKALLKVDYKATIESECEHIHINRATGSFHLKTGKQISSIPMPKALVDRILDSMDKGIDFEPLIKMWTRWLRNPVLRTKTANGEGEAFSNKMFNYINSDYTNHELYNKLMDEEGVSEEVARERATTKQVGITVEGLLRTFKVSREIHTKYELDDNGERKQVQRKKAESIDPDTGLITYTDLSNEDRLFEPAVQGTRGDAFFCGDKEGHFIRVGEAHRLASWSMVDTNDNRSCRPGLHCGGLDYIDGYQNEGTETHNVLVDPMNIGAVPCDDRGAIRVLEYYVLDAFSGVNGSIYHSSTYAAQSDAKWEEDRKAAMKEYGELLEAAETQANEIKAL